MRIRLACVLCFCALALAGCGKSSNGAESGTAASSKNGINSKSTESEETMLKTEQWTIDNHGPVYAYMPDDLDPEEKVPLVLDMNCTTGNPQGEVLANGWDEEAVQERFIVVAPTYDDYATYSEVDYIIQVLDSAQSRYNIDTSRVYSTGFSNGGALSVALASEHPERIAAISAAGWMVGARDTEHGYRMPFQVLQGTEEYTKRDSNGDMEIMGDEREAIADLFAMNGMNRGKPDYHTTPYWGYQPDKTTEIYPDYTDYDWQGKNPVKKNGIRWTVSDYYADGYSEPLAQFILIDGADHVPHDYHATAAWEFFRHFRRDGKDIVIRE